MKKYYPFFVFITLCALFFSACTSDVGSPDHETVKTGSLTVLVPQVASADASKSVYAPSVGDLTINHYTVELSNPGNAKIEDCYTSSPIIIEGIPIGTQTVTVTGYNASNEMVTDPLSQDVNIDKGTTNSATFFLTKVTGGTGTLIWSLSWNPDIEQNVQFLVVSLQKNNEEKTHSVTVALSSGTSENGTKTFSITDSDMTALEAGTYTSTITLYKEGTKENPQSEVYFALHDVVHVYAGLTTHIDITIPNEYRPVSAPTVDVTGDGQVTIKNNTDGADVFYTFTPENGTKSESIQYSGPFSVNQSGTLAAWATIAGFKISSLPVEKQIRLVSAGSFAIINPKTVADYTMNVAKPANWSGIVEKGSLLSFSASFRGAPSEASFSYTLDGGPATASNGGTYAINSLEKGAHTLIVDGTADGFAYSETIIFTVVNGIGSATLSLDTDGLMLKDGDKDFAVTVVLGNVATTLNAVNPEMTLNLAEGAYTPQVNLSGLDGYQLSFDESIVVEKGKATPFVVTIRPDDATHYTQEVSFAFASGSGLDPTKRVVFHASANGTHYDSLSYPADGTRHSFKIPVLGSGHYRLAVNYVGDDTLQEEAFYANSSGVFDTATHMGWGKATLRWRRAGNDTSDSLSVYIHDTANNLTGTSNAYQAAAGSTSTYRYITFWAAPDTYQVTVTCRIDGIENDYIGKVTIDTSGNPNVIEMTKKDSSSLGTLAVALESTLIPDDVRNDIEVDVLVDGQVQGSVNYSKRTLSFPVGLGAHTVSALIKNVGEIYTITEGTGTVTVSSPGEVVQRTLYLDYDSTKYPNLATVTVEFPTDATKGCRFRLRKYIGNGDSKTSSGYRTINPVKSTRVFHIPEGNWYLPEFKFSNDGEAYFAVEKTSWNSTDESKRYTPADFWTLRSISKDSPITYLALGTRFLGRKKVTLHYPKSYSSSFPSAGGYAEGDMNVRWVGYATKETSDNVQVFGAGSKDRKIYSEFSWLPNGVYYPSLHSPTTGKYYVIVGSGGSLTIDDSKDAYEFDVRAMDPNIDIPATVVFSLENFQVPWQSSLELRGIDGIEPYSCDLPNTFSKNPDGSYTLNCSETLSLYPGRYEVEGNGTVLKVFSVTKFGESLIIDSLDYPTTNNGASN